MKLPPADEIVMVAGTPPIRAKKARYFEDARLQERILPPPELPSVLPTKPATDDWTSRRIVAADHTTARAASGAEGDSDTAGIRREPELPAPEDRTSTRLHSST